MAGPDAQPSGGATEQQLRDVNEALLVSSVHQHELTEVAQKAEAALRESEERYRTLFTSMDEAYCVIEVLFDTADRAVDYRFLETNPAFEKQTGLHGASGRRIRDIAPKQEEYWFATYGKVALTGEPTRFVNQAKELGGRWFDVYAFRLGKPAEHRVAILFTDITKRRELEDKTLEQSQALADSNRRKDEFLAMLSHELRNPLAAILNAIHLLRLQQNRTPLQIEAHAMIDRQVAHLARLVDDLLEVSRIATGRIHLQMQRLDMRGVVQRAVEATRAQAERKHQTFTANLPDGPACVSGDAVRLEQVVVNLISNASKYTANGGQLAVTLSVDNTQAVLEVVDNGVGISGDMLPRVFDLFTQADKSLDRSQGGLGIGLALVKSIVSMHDGTVDVQSTLGAGSRFIVRLPRIEAATAPSAESSALAPTKGHTVKVLVVDDNEDAAASLAILLGASGHEARVAHDGETAKKVALEYHPEAILLDIGLPVSDGYEVAKWIRSQPSISDIVLIALTGHGQNSDRDRAFKAGFDHHLIKPVDFEKIEGVLSAIARNGLNEAPDHSHRH